MGRVACGGPARRVRVACSAYATGARSACSQALVRQSSMLSSSFIHCGRGIIRYSKRKASTTGAPAPGNTPNAPPSRSAGRPPARGSPRSVNGCQREREAGHPPGVALLYTLLHRRHDLIVYSRATPGGWPAGGVTAGLRLACGRRDGWPADGVAAGLPALLHVLFDPGNEIFDVVEDGERLLGAQAGKVDGLGQIGRAH